MTRNRKRPWLAALLALVYPGLGHAYLRQWLRALLWFGFALTTAMVFIPEQTFQSVETGGWSAYVQAVQGLKTSIVLPILVVQLCNILDAYWAALRGNRAAAVTGGRGTQCPNCGREVDEDLDFCQWCTAPLERDATAQ
ncbi:zinc ribbon domain-containing protein [Haladaptatus salinisoli]|uniref:zinc ribbon domain-containing protein n=1 Tax=Haladaptatus salinisoli TaxID=2884876 RepID=UPI001D09BDB4|nr:zinc ribbon domain-containing protein [Haladaptatus salinisoli]